MIRFLIPVILIVLAVVLARRYINAAPADKQKSRKIDVLLIALTLVLLAMTLLHRMHWLGVTVPALIMAGRKFVDLVSTIFSNKKENASAANRSSPGSTPYGGMTEEEALNILGLQKPYSQNEVTEAHRKLIQKVHPDRGGNDYLAAKINDAKELLQNKL
jgi:DnaJ homolog subfamily C member 19